MRPCKLILAVSVVLFGGAGYGRGELQVRAEGSRVFVQVSRVALSEVLDRLASATGMKVVYDGPRPHQLVTAHIDGRSEVESVLALLEGQGINYALKLDPSGRHVESLILITDIARGGAPSGLRPATPPVNVGAEAPPEELPVDTETAPVPEQPESEREMPPGFNPRRMPMPIVPGPVPLPGVNAPSDIAPPGARPPGMPSFPGTPSNPAGTI